MGMPVSAQIFLCSCYLPWGSESLTTPEVEMSIYRELESLMGRAISAYNIRAFIQLTPPLQTQGGSGGLEALSLIK